MNRILYRGGKWLVLSRDETWVIAKRDSFQEAVEWRKQHCTTAARHLHLMAATGVIRTATFEQREHVVVPVVALVEGVLFPVNAASPELVLAEEFSKTPQGWNGRPVLPNHPADDKGQTSANEPKTLETKAFGKVFHTKVDGKRLVMEAWLDVARAQLVGAQGVLERIRHGEMVEVSVGVYVTAEQRSGIWNGQPYSSVWRELVPDHLALLPEGTIGACSNEMGCGTPRTATVHLITAQGFTAVRPHTCIGNGCNQYGCPSGAGGTGGGSDDGGLAGKPDGGNGRMSDHLSRAQNVPAEALGSAVTDALGNGMEHSFKDEFNMTPKEEDALRSFMDGNVFVAGYGQPPLGHDLTTPSKNMQDVWSKAKTMGPAKFGHSFKEALGNAVETDEYGSKAEAKALDKLLSGTSLPSKRNAAQGGRMAAKPKPWRDKIPGFQLVEEPAPRAAQNTVSDIDLRNALDAALRATVPGYLGVDTVFPQESLVVYAVAPGDSVQLYRCGYQLADDGTVSMSGTPEEVRPVTSFEPVAAQPTTAATGGCGCKKSSTPAGGSPMSLSKNGERIKKLLASKKLVGAESDIPALEKIFSDAALDALEAEPVAAAVVPEPKAAAAAEPAKPKTEEEYLKDAPESIRSLVAEDKSRKAARKTELIAALDATKQTAYTAEELKAMDAPQLEKLVTLKGVTPTNVVDFAGRGLPRESTNADQQVPAPPSLTANIRTARGVKQ